MADKSMTKRFPFPRSPRSGRVGDGRSGASGSAAVSSPRGRRRLPAALILLSVVPLVAGAVRLSELAGGAAVTPGNARFFAAPLPVVAHIVCVSLYSVPGAFQFAADFRRRRPGLHRAAGWLLIPCGLGAAITGLWMTLFYPRPPGDGDLLTGFRLVFGTAMVMSILLGVAAIRRRDVARHRAWMMRGYAIGLGAGTQVLTHLPWFLFFGAPGEFTRALLVGAGWVINLAVAEWFIRKRPVRSPRPLTGPADARLSF